MPHHVVVDGSNIATEGRQMPSLAQLNEAVMAFIEEHPDALITVVVDATFGHRIDAKEVKEFDAAVANNEVVAPPAGAVGRGDAFVLSIANKVNATILSNDSFQEFHPQYDWLFDEGRLIGGKPVPHIGWVFVPRVPVRGQVSRSAMKQAKRKSGDIATVRTGSPEASLPMPIPKTPPPGRGRAPKPVVPAAPTPVRATTAPPAERSPAPRGTHVNDQLAFLEFVGQHPKGSSVNAVVESYSSHGAYVKIGDVTGYVPLRLMSDPAPRSAREFTKIGDALTLVVDDFHAARRSVDLAVPAMATTRLVVEAAAPAKRTRAKKADAPTPMLAPTPAAEPETLAAPVKASRAKKVAPAAEVTAPAAPAVPAKPTKATTPTKATKATTPTKATKATTPTKATKATKASKAQPAPAPAPETPAKPTKLPKATKATKAAKAPTAEKVTKAAKVTTAAKAAKPAKAAAARTARST